MKDNNFSKPTNECHSLDVINVKLVDAVVAQMHARVPNVWIRQVVLDSGESHQPLLVQVDQQWIIAGDNDVEPQVALVPSHQKRIIYVLRNDH